MLLQRSVPKACESCSVGLKHGWQGRVEWSKCWRLSESGFDGVEGSVMPRCPLEDVLGTEKATKILCAGRDVSGEVSQLVDQAEERAKLGDIRRSGELGDGPKLRWISRDAVLADLVATERSPRLCEVELRLVECDAMFTAAEKHSSNAVDVGVEAQIPEKRVIPDFAQLSNAAEGDVSTAVVFITG